MIYLGRYRYRGVLQEQDILACDEDGQVTFRYRDAKTRRRQTRTLPGADFLWLLLQHVLPKGLRRARNFGFLHPNSKRLIERLRLLLKFAPDRTGAWVRLRPALTCPGCGGTLRIIRTRIRPLPWCADPTDALEGALAM